MKWIYRIASLIEWIACSYFGIPEPIFIGSRIQCEEWVNHLETSFSQIAINIPNISLTANYCPGEQPVNHISDIYKLMQS